MLKINANAITLQTLHFLISEKKRSKEGITP